MFRQPNKMFSCGGEKKTQGCQRKENRSVRNAAKRRKKYRCVLANTCLFCNSHLKILLNLGGSGYSLFTGRGARHAWKNEDFLPVKIEFCSVPQNMSQQRTRPVNQNVLTFSRFVFKCFIFNWPQNGNAYALNILRL